MHAAFWFFILGPIPCVVSEGGNVTNALNTRIGPLLGWHTTPVSITLFYILGLVFAAMLTKMAISVVAQKGFDLKKLIPESGLLIIVGLIIGGIVRGIGTTEDQVSLVFDSELYFYFLLPIIFFEAAYTVNLKFFYHNIIPIVMFAFFLTFLGCLGTGFSLWGFSFSKTFTLSYSLPLILIFCAAISANESISIIQIFKDLHVNLKLYTLIQGESMLNDPVSTVMFTVLISLLDASDFNGTFVGLAIGKFFIVLFGGVLVGAVIGYLGSFITRFSNLTPSIEPLFVVFVGFTSFAVSDSLYFSGFISIFFCGVILNEYTGYNISRHSSHTTRHTLLAIAQTTESILFVELGIALVVHDHYFDWGLILATVLFLLIWRIILTFVLMFFYNYVALCRRKENRIPYRDQVIISLSGIRGAISFVLTLLIYPETEKHSSSEEDLRRRASLITATLMIILFTTFIQSTALRPLVWLLHIRREKDELKKVHNVDALPNDIRLSDIHIFPVSVIQQGIKELESTQEDMLTAVRPIMKHVRMIIKQLRALNSRFQLALSPKVVDPRHMKKRFLASEEVRLKWQTYLTLCNLQEDSIMSTPIIEAVNMINGQTAEKKPAVLDTIRRSLDQVTTKKPVEIKANPSNPVIDILLHCNVIEPTPPIVPKRVWWKLKRKKEEDTTVPPPTIRLTTWANDKEYVYYLIRVLHEEMYMHWRNRMLKKISGLPETQQDCIQLLRILEEEVAKNEERKTEYLSKMEKQSSAVQILGEFGIANIVETMHAFVEKPYATHPSRILSLWDRVSHPLKQHVFNFMVRSLNTEEVKVVRALVVLQKPDYAVATERKQFITREQRIRFHMFWEKMRRWSLAVLMHSHTLPRVNLMRIIGSEIDTNKRYDELLGMSYPGFGVNHEEEMVEIEDGGDIAMNELIEEMEEQED